MARIAVIGAGLAGLVVARELATSHEVTVYEKSRGVGGRMATRRAEPYQFDHGAQFFTARTKAFQGFLEPLIAAGLVSDWPAVFAELDRNGIASGRQWSAEYPHYVGVPGMNAVGKRLASGLDVRLETVVNSLTRQGNSWLLQDEGGRQPGEFDWTIIATPAPQASSLLASVGMSKHATVAMDACFALLLGFAAPLDLPWQAALVRDADISWISVDSHKPGRPGPSSLVVHSTNAWANEHLEDEPRAVERHMLAELARVSGVNGHEAEHVGIHRWRYANADRQDGDLYAVEPDQGLAICGDWFVRGRIEGAFMSATALAGRLKQEIH